MMTLDNTAVRELTTAIVRQAVDDWRYLCKGGEPRDDCDFGELTRFFESGCAGYISQGAAERIYKKLREERRRYENALQNQSVC
jgi:hypothetical protein